MTKTHLLVLLFCIQNLLTNSAEAFIPPVLAMLKEVTEGRRVGPVEVVLKHRVAVRGAGPVEIEERILNERGKLSFLWSGQAFPQPVSASWERYNYIVGDKNIPARSIAFVNYLTANTADNLKDVFIAEQFIRRDQLLQFKPGWTPVGDPQTWEMRENYLRHSDIFLHRMPAGIAFAVVGLEEGSVRKAVYFDRTLRGMRRLEWKDGDQSHSWNFESFSNIVGSGTFPKRIYFEENGVEVITTDLVAVRPLDGRALADFKNNWRQSSSTNLAANSEGVMKLLLSFR